MNRVEGSAYGSRARYAKPITVKVGNIPAAKIYRSNVASG